MRTNQTFAISFFIRKKKSQPEFAILYARITVNGKSLEISLKRAVPVLKWNQSSEKLLGRSPESFQINKKIDETRSLVHLAYDKLLKEDKIITSHLIKARFLGTDQQHHSIIDLLHYHSTKMDKVLKYGTLKNYNTTETYLKDYIKAHYKTSDIYLKNIDYEFTLGFESYLRNLDGLNNNGLMKHMERFKKLMRLAEHLDWIEKNPTKRFKLHFDTVDMVYLSKAELQKIESQELENPTLRINRDIFVFACYTGLAYADVKTLSKNNLQIGIDGRKWIYIRRSKTNTSVRIPLLEEAEKILEYYKDHPVMESNEILLPVYSRRVNTPRLASLVNI